ncbi:MAG: hypothetical protein ACHP82_05930 [Hyphomicrobiales bacterium]
MVYELIEPGPVVLLTTAHILPRARSIVWLGLKVYMIVVLGISLIGMAAVLLVIALIAVMG